MPENYDRRKSRGRRDYDLRVTALMTSRKKERKETIAILENLLERTRSDDGFCGIAYIMLRRNLTYEPGFGGLALIYPEHTDGALNRLHCKLSQYISDTFADS